MHAAGACSSLRIGAGRAQHAPGAEGIRESGVNANGVPGVQLAGQSKAVTVAASRSGEARSSGLLRRASRESPEAGSMPSRRRLRSARWGGAPATDSCLEQQLGLRQWVMTLGRARHTQMRATR
eukprot:scaffold272675_cov31-Tisochrysis_lutea.AAC.2